MPNAIKYNVSAETLALKKGNFWIGTGDVGKGPTSSTGYYNGIDPPSGGYTIYLNKASGGPSIYTVTTVAQLTGLTHIDFLKFDCEGGEYDIFSEQNIDFLKTVPKIACEMHLRTNLHKEKFRYFRDNILQNFTNFKFRSVDFADITWDLNNEHFIEYYKEVYLFIDNRKL